MWLFALIACPGGPVDSSSDSVDSCPTEDTGTQIGVIEDSCRCEEPWAEIGTGLEGYEEIGPDGLEMVHGPQGGWHLPGALKVANTRNVIRIWAQVRDSDSGIAVTEELNYHVQLVDTGECQGVFPNMYLYLDTWLLDDSMTPGMLLSCRDLVIEMCVTDTSGHDFCTEKEVFALPDPTDVASAQAPECG